MGRIGWLEVGPDQTLFADVAPRDVGSDEDAQLCRRQALAGSLELEQDRRRLELRLLVAAGGNVVRQPHRQDEAHGIDAGVGPFQRGVPAEIQPACCVGPEHRA